MKKIGIITYHAAYNFGSVLQAYATQEVVRRLGYEAKIINYRPIAQKRFYGIVCVGNGYKRFAKSILQLRNFKQRRLRVQKYEDFISQKLVLTTEINYPQETSSFSDEFDIYISGSDQIWNKHSNELYRVNWDYMNPYLLSFTNRRKISYASSLGDMTEEEIDHVSEQINLFDFISCREKDSSIILSKKLNRHVENVLDPTLLLSSEEWDEALQIVSERKSGNYILYYSLQGIGTVEREINQIRSLFPNYRIIAIAPLAPFKADRMVTNSSESGPDEFVNLIKNAKLVITSSYHGTLFSINYNVPFYTIKRKNKVLNLRFNNILSLLGLEDRLVDEIKDGMQKFAINYDEANGKLCIHRTQSIGYLRKALE